MRPLPRRAACLVVIPVLGWLAAACGGKQDPPATGAAPGPTGEDAGTAAGGGGDGADGGGEAGGDGADDSGPRDSGGGRTDARPPVVVLLIGDGMGDQHVRGASLLSAGRPGALTMETAPHIGWLQTASLSGFTDSAAAATTLHSGVKTTNGRIGQDADGVELSGLVDRARAAGMAVGVVTTDTLTGATPTAFLTHAESRYDTATLAAGLAAAPPEVLLGGGATALGPLFDAGAVTLVGDAAALAAAARDPAAADRPLVGLFAPVELPFVAEPAGAPPAAGATAAPALPRLPALVDAALDRLLADPDGALLVVEAARIDHASHQNRTDLVFHEVVELDETLARVLERLAPLAETHATTVVLTADHECGGLALDDDILLPDGVPAATWRWRDHTNRDVPVYAWGDAAASLGGVRQHNSAVYAVLDGALQGRAPAAVALPRLADGQLDDLGAAAVHQTVATDFGAGFNQLDGLRLTADADGLWIGVDGVFDDRANAVVAWIDADLGAGTGVGAGRTLADERGAVDRLLSATPVHSGAAGLGFDAAVVQQGATLLRRESLLDEAGLRVFSAARGAPDDLAWQPSIVNYDDGNVADGVAAADAGATGATVHGMELFVPHDALWPDGLPAAGATLGVLLTLHSTDGATVSSQALPPQDLRPADGPGIAVSTVLSLTVDGSGAVVAGPVAWP